MKDTIYNSLNLNGFFSISKKQSIKLINELEKKKNVRLCLHSSNSSTLHVMLIKFNKSKKNLMHFHKRKCEFYFVLSGRLDIVVKIGKTFKHNILKENEMLYLNNNTIHSVNVFTKHVIFLEIRPGPFNKNDSIRYVSK
jgi:cupin fold WbuC family metalloprotein